jgi:hypothetical protein
LISGGMGVTLPTADDVRLFADAVTPTPLLHVHNRSVLLDPFLGWAYTPTDYLFVQGFAQMLFNAGGDPLDVNGARVGRLMSAPLFYAGLGAGWVLYEDRAYRHVVNSVIPMLELHNTTDIGNYGNAGNFSPSSLAGSVLNRTNQIDALNVTFGTNIGLWRSANLNVGVGLPVIGDHNRQYNWTALAQFNYFFGGGR